MRGVDPIVVRLVVALLQLLFVDKAAVVVIDLAEERAARGKEEKRRNDKRAREGREEKKPAERPIWEEREEKRD